MSTIMAAPKSAKSPIGKKRKQTVDQSIDKTSMQSKKIKPSIVVKDKKNKKDAIAAVPNEALPNEANESVPDKTTDKTVLKDNMSSQTSNVNNMKLEKLVSLLGPDQVSDQLDGMLMIKTNKHKKQELFQSEWCGSDCNNFEVGPLFRFERNAIIDALTRACGISHPVTGKTMKSSITVHYRFDRYDDFIRKHSKDNEKMSACSHINICFRSSKSKEKQVEYLNQLSFNELNAIADVMSHEFAFNRNAPVGLMIQSSAIQD